MLAVATGLAIAVIAVGTLLGDGDATAKVDSAALGNRNILGFKSPVVYNGTHITLTDSLQPIQQTVRISEADLGRSLDATPLTCHGGRIRVSWSVGNLEPTVSDTGITLTARLDGKPIGALIRGSSRGNYNDAPAGITGVVACPTGSHVVDLVITSIQGVWGIPYVNDTDAPPVDDFLVNRGFVIEEIW